MKATFRLIDVGGEPLRLRVYPMPETPEEQGWVLKATNEKLHFNFEIEGSSVKLALIELAEINARR